MALQKYDVVVDGVRTQVKLSDADATRLGLKRVEVKESPKPHNKARTVKNKAK